MTLMMNAVALGITLAYASVAGAASTATVSQTGAGGNDAYVEQAGNTGSSVAITQEGSNRIGEAAGAKHGVQQESSIKSSIAIQQYNMASATVKQLVVDTGSIQLGQTGTSLQATIEQNKGSHLLVDAIQSGASHALDLQQYNVNDGRQAASQLAEGNRAKLVQINSSGVRATLEQTGNSADALIVQDNVVNSSVTTKQQGLDNRAYIDQRDGTDLIVNANQSSGPQLLNVYQSGTLSTVTADQSGSWNEARLLQAGTNNTINLTQVGSGTDLATRNIANIDQSGSNLTANLTQNGARQIAAIKQR